MTYTLPVFFAVCCSKVFRARCQEIVFKIDERVASHVQLSVGILPLDAACLGSHHWQAPTDMTFIGGFEGKYAPQL
jgi:hypothetical protein